MDYSQPEAAKILNAKIDEEAESLHDEILNRLRDFIVEGHLRPGDRVPERQLCESLGVSRTPLREALKVLAAEGLIELLPNRGARIREFTPADVREFFEILAGLESTAGRLACERITEKEIEEIEALHYQMYGHYMRRELPEYFRLNQLIHEHIVAAAGNRALETYYHGLTARMRRLRYTANTIKRDRWGQAMREHEQIIDALRRRDGRELAEILHDHLINKWRAASEAIKTAEAE